MQIGFTGLLTLLLVAAKLFGFVSWSWWLVFAPVLFGIVLSLLIMLFAVVITLWVAKKG